MPIVTLEEVRLHLRLDEDDAELSLLPGVVAGAAAYIEGEYGIVSEERQETFLFDSLCPAVPFPLRPIQSATLTVVSVDAAGVETAVTEFRRFDRLGRSYVHSAAFGPAEVTATIGFPADADAASDRCFGAAKAATLIMAGHLFTDREGASPVPLVVDRLLDQFRLKRV